MFEFEVEPLESRRLLAGSVTADIVGDNLVINGDAFGNEIVIRATAGAGSFLVQGIGGTSVNTTNAAFVHGVDDVKINLRNGDNIVLLTRKTANNTTETFVADDVTIRTSKGNDIVLLDGVDLGGRLRITTARGDDVIRIRNSQVTGTSQFLASAGDDSVTFHTTTMAGRTTVSTTQGEDLIVSDLSTFEDNLTIRAGSDYDHVGHLETTVIGDYLLISHHTATFSSQNAFLGRITRRLRGGGSTSGHANPAVPRNTLHNVLVSQPGGFESESILANLSG